MLSKCDNNDCKNGMIQEYEEDCIGDITDIVISQYDCEECKWIEENADEDGCYTMHYDRQGNIIN